MIKWQREGSPAGGSALVGYLVTDGAVEKVAEAWRTGSRLETGRWAWRTTTPGVRGESSTLFGAKRDAEAAIKSRSVRQEGISA